MHPLSQERRRSICCVQERWKREFQGLHVPVSTELHKNTEAALVTVPSKTRRQVGCRMKVCTPTQPSEPHSPPVCICRKFQDVLIACMHVAAGRSSMKSFPPICDIDRHLSTTGGSRGEPPVTAPCEPSGGVKGGGVKSRERNAKALSRETG